MGRVVAADCNGGSSLPIRSHAVSVLRASPGSLHQARKNEIPSRLFDLFMCDRRVGPDRRGGCQEPAGAGRHGHWLGLRTRVSIRLWPRNRESCALTVFKGALSSTRGDWRDDGSERATPDPFHGIRRAVRIHPGSDRGRNEVLSTGRFVWRSPGSRGSHFGRGRGGAA